MLVSVCQICILMVNFPSLLNARGWCSEIIRFKFSALKLILNARRLVRLRQISQKKTNHDELIILDHFGLKA